MNGIDWAIIAAYLLGMILFSVYLGRNQSDEEDYYVAGRRMSWWAIGISTMATQTSAISFISKPAFVALRPGGGLNWLQYEMAVPLSVIFIMMILLPFFHQLKLVSVYEYLELRFDRSIRRLVSGVFLLSRGMSAAVVVYASAIVLSVCLEIPLWITIVIIGVVTVIYDTIGGMTAVVYSDVIQMVILLVGIGACLLYAADSVGGFAQIFAAFPAERMQTLDFSTGINDDSAVPFWGLLIGGFFLYMSYYGTDQSQVQRELSAESVSATKKSLLLNGLARFPLTGLYMLVGIAVFAVYQQSPELQAAVPDDHLDYLVPQFILLHLPTGLRALLFAALLAATMSSLDSVLNSLSAATIRDFIDPNNQLGDRTLWMSKVVTVAWGTFATGFAFAVGQFETIVEGINKIGSAFYGPILAAFLVGILSRRATTSSIFAGIIAGVSFNIVLWQFLSEVHWIWWNFTGTLLAAGVTMLISILFPKPVSEKAERYTLSAGNILNQERSWFPVYGILVGYFVLILISLAAIQYWGMN